MSAKPNYFKIGIFVIVAVMLVLAAVIVFGAGLLMEQKIYFETYFDSSVSGLSVGAPTENRGVPIGRVEKIAFVRDIYHLKPGSDDYFKYGEYVVVVCSVSVEAQEERVVQERKATLQRQIHDGLRVRLASNLLTGQAYLQANKLDPNRYPAFKPPWTPQNLYIPSAPGELTTLKTSVDKILQKLEKIDTDQIGKNLEEVLAVLKTRIEDANIGPAVKEVTALFAEARETNQHLQELLGNKEPRTEMGNVPRLVAELNATLIRIDRLVSSQTPHIEETMANIRKVSADLEELTETLKRYPSDALFGQPPPKSEALE